MFLRFFVFVFVFVLFCFVLFFVFTFVFLFFVCLFCFSFRFHFVFCLFVFCHAERDNIKAYLIKCVANEILKPMAIIFNMSLSNGIVPDELKKVKVVPIYKKENPEIFGNYRPVSVLPCISKILERIVYNRSYDFFVQK